MAPRAPTPGPTPPAVLRARPPNPHQSVPQENASASPRPGSDTPPPETAPEANPRPTHRVCHVWRGCPNAPAPSDTAPATVRPATPRRWEPARNASETTGPSQQACPDAASVRGPLRTPRDRSANRQWRRTGHSAAPLPARSPPPLRAGQQGPTPRDNPESLSSCGCPHGAGWFPPGKARSFQILPGRASPPATPRIASDS